MTYTHRFSLSRSSALTFDVYGGNSNNTLYSHHVYAQLE